MVTIYNIDDTADHCGRVDADIIGFTCRENNIQYLPHAGKTLRSIKKNLYDF